MEELRQHFGQTLSTLRTGRAHSSMVEDILVEAYGVRTPVVQLASITIADPHTLAIQPWDKTISKDIEKALTLSSRGFTVANDGSTIRVHLAPLTEEHRKELSKVVRGRLEEARKALRQLRDEIRESIVKNHRDGRLTEDAKYRLFKELDEWVGETQQKLEQAATQKEAEVMGT